MRKVHPASVLDVLREFIARVDELDPAAPVLGELTFGLNDETDRVTLRAPVAKALAEALSAYRDPRDQGACAHCRSGRLDDNLVCRDCGMGHGVFGQMIAELMTRHQPPHEDRPV